MKTITAKRKTAVSAGSCTACRGLVSTGHSTVLELELGRHTVTVVRLCDPCAADLGKLLFSKVKPFRGAHVLHHNGTFGIARKQVSAREWQITPKGHLDRVPSGGPDFVEWAECIRVIP